MSKTPAQHWALAKKLAPLREKGVLVLGSGNIVHNLMLADYSSGPYDWAVGFDATVRRLIEAGDAESLVNYEGLGESARLSIPTSEHYLPMLYAIALREKDEAVRFFAEGINWGSISMRSLLVSRAGPD